MNINKRLCDKYDKKNRGYVEIGDILPDMLKMCVVMCYGILVLNGIRLIIFPCQDIVLATPIMALSLICCIAGCIGITGMVILLIVYGICTTKIVKCKEVK